MRRIRSKESSSKRIAVMPRQAGVFIRTARMSEAKVRIIYRMAPSLLFDISDINMDRVLRDAAAIEAINPHRGDMRLIDAIVLEEDNPTRIVAYKDILEDAFWVPGHIPGRPIFPGVLMIEASAQLASYVYLRNQEPGHFMGFSGLDDVKFRGQVRPGDRFVVLCEQVELRRRRCICKAQGVVNGNLVYEATITGMPL